jgi:hypothetical protein
MGLRHQIDAGSSVVMAALRDDATMRRSAQLRERDREALGFDGGAASCEGGEFQSEDVEPELLIDRPSLA